MATLASNGVPVKLTCQSEARINVEIHKYHGTALKLCNIGWLVTKKCLSKPLLGPPILEGLGLSPYEILATFADRRAKTVDAKWLAEYFGQYGRGWVFRVVQGVFYSDGGKTENLDDEELEECGDIFKESDREWELNSTQKQ